MRTRMDENDVLRKCSRHHWTDAWPSRSRPVLIVHSDPAPDRFQRDPSEGGLHAGVALYVSCGDQTIAVLHRQIAADPFRRDTSETGLSKGVSGDVGERDAPFPVMARIPFGTFELQWRQRRTSK